VLARNVLNHLLLWDLRCFLLRLNNAFSALYPKLSQDEASVCCEPWLLLYPLLESLFWVAVGPCFVKVYTCILHLHASIHQLDFHLRALFQALKSILDGKTLTGEFLKPTDPEYASQATSLLFAVRIVGVGSLAFVYAMNSDRTFRLHHMVPTFSCWQS